MILDYHPRASDELIEAAGFYEGRQAGLGYRFLDAVEASLARLKNSPRLAPSDDQGRRRLLVHGFPYVIVYRIEAAFLYVLAIAHTSRNPGYWGPRDDDSI